MNGKASTILNTSCLSELSRIRAAKTLKIRIALFIKSGSFWLCSYYSPKVSNVVTKHFQFDLTCLLFYYALPRFIVMNWRFCPMFCFPKCFPATLLSILRWNEIKIAPGSHRFCSCFKILFLLTLTLERRWCLQTELLLWSCWNAYWETLLKNSLNPVKRSSFVKQESEQNFLMPDTEIKMM